MPKYHLGLSLLVEKKPSSKVRLGLESVAFPKITTSLFLAIGYCKFGSVAVAVAGTGDPFVLRVGESGKSGTLALV